MSCPFCHNAQSSLSIYPLISFNKKEFRYLKCRNCGLIYLNNFPDGDDYTAMYPPSYQQNEVETDVLEDPTVKGYGLRYSYGYQFDLVKKNIGTGARILDYGCGTGHFIANALHYGYACDGAEFSPAYVSMLAERLTKSNFYTIDEVLRDSFVNKYDVIRLSNVLEHLAAPAEIIRKLICHLNPGGIILVEGPIEENFCLATSFRKLYFGVSKWLKPGRVVSGPPYHIFFSNARNQRQFFKDCGLTETHFNTSEDPWPFPESFTKAKGVQQKIMALIAESSVILTKLFPAKWGNVFIYSGKKTAG